jgi:hypothetical protein
MMMLCQDYRLTALFETSIDDFELYLQPWLENAILDFNICTQSLAYDTTTRVFSETLETSNIIILSNLMIKYWMTKNVNDITQMNLHVLDRDFKVFSEAQNLREKTNQLNLHIERCSQMLIDYGYRSSNIDWDAWFSQNFAGA